MILPEVILYNSIKNLLNLVMNDWNTNSDKSQTILSDLFNVDDNGDTLSIDTYNYYTQAQAILLKDTKSPRKLEIYIGYNLQRLQVPTIHILMPSESKGNMDTLGDLPDDPAIINNPNQEITTKIKSSSAVYNLMITSDNSSEVLIVYYFLKGIMTMYDFHFELSGLRNFTFSGSDIQFQQDLTPNNIFHRNLSVSFQYKSSVILRRNLSTTVEVGFGLCADEVTDFYLPETNPSNQSISSINTLVS